MSMFDFNSIQNMITSIQQSYDANEGSYLMDMMTVSAGNTLSDTIAQVAEQRGKGSSMNSIQDPRRLIRFATFGFLDGAVGHQWFLTLNHFIPGSTPIDLVNAMVADVLIYTPLWCLWYLFGMSLLQGKDASQILSTIRSEFKELLGIDILFFLPVSLVIYTTVPLNRRVLAFSFFELIYTIIVSHWSHEHLEEYNDVQNGTMLLATNTSSISHAVNVDI